MSLLELFCDVDDFCKQYQQSAAAKLLGTTKKKGPNSRLALSELMTIVIHFHQKQYRTFKAYYTDFVCVYLTKAFPNLVSYNRFVELMPRTIIPLYTYLKSRFGRVTGISFIDSTSLAVCRNKRIERHRVF